MPTRSRILTIVAVLAAGLVLACSGGAEPEGREVRTISQSGISRDYIVHFPSDLSSRSAWPVLVAFHPAFASAADFERITGLHDVPGAEDFIVVYPDGFRRSWNVGNCCGRAHERGLDDVGLLRAIMDDLGEVTTIEPRAYVTGFSNGAMLVYRLVCDHADIVAAAAPAGATIQLDAADCSPSRPVPLMHLHGEDDRFAPLNGGMSAFERVGVQPSVQAGVTRIAQAEQCTRESSRRLVSDVTCEDWSGCAAGSEVLLCVIPDLGHLWPGAGQGAFGRMMDLGPSRTDVSASTLIVQFFQQQR